MFVPIYLFDTHGQGKPKSNYWPEAGGECFGLPLKEASVSLFHYFLSQTSFNIFSAQMDPIVGYGKHFGRTVSAMTDISALITNGLNRMVDMEGGTTVIEELPVE